MVTGKLCSLVVVVPISTLNQWFSMWCIEPNAKYFHFATHILLSFVSDQSRTLCKTPTLKHPLSKKYKNVFCIYIFYYSKKIVRLKLFIKWTFYPYLAVWKTCFISNTHCNWWGNSKQGKLSSVILFKEGEKGRVLK